MKFLLDTHLLIWVATFPERISAEAHEYITNVDNELFFSVVSLWEIAIKSALDRKDFTVDVRLLRRGLLDNGYKELPVIGEHVIAITGLPQLHKDPFDRLLIAQSMVEGVTLLTADAIVSQYPGPIQKI